MKIEIHTLRYGNPFWMKECAPTLDAWCKRHNLPLVVTSEWNPEYPSSKFCEVDMLRAFLAGDSDQMMYVDSDVVVNQKAPAPEFGPGFHIRPEQRSVNNPLWLEWYLKHYGETPPESAIYHNAGVWVCDRESAKKMLKAANEPYIEGVMEQHQWNRWIMKAKAMGMNVVALSRVWNSYPRDWEPAFFYHIYGEKKVEWLRQLKIRRLAYMTIKPNAPFETHMKAEPLWPMNMDKLHVDLLRDLLAKRKPKVAMEIGSFEGISTQAFLDALDAGDIGHLHIVELAITPVLQTRIDLCKNKDRITVHTKPSWEVMQPADFVFIDGHHGNPAYIDTLVSLALGASCIAMHDTCSKSIGIPGCDGSQGAWNILKAAKGRAFEEDNANRPGMFTHRGFGWSIADSKTK